MRGGNLQASGADIAVTCSAIPEVDLPGEKTEGSGRPPQSYRKSGRKRSSGKAEAQSDRKGHPNVEACPVSLGTRWLEDKADSVPRPSHP